MININNQGPKSDSVFQGLSMTGVSCHVAIRWYPSRKLKSIILTEGIQSLYDRISLNVVASRAVAISPSSLYNI